MSEFLVGLLEANIAAAVAVAIVLMARGWVRRHSGAHAAYLLWAIVPVAMLATLVPARTVVIEAPATLLASRDFENAAILARPDTDWIGMASSALPWLWTAGFAAMAIWLLLGQSRFLGDVKRGTAGPAVVGLLRPHIVIPSDFGGRFEVREQELILAHEHFHLARQDARLNTLVALVRCVCWFNPMIHVGAHVMRIDQELSCDAAVVGRRPGVRRAYAETLLKTQLAARPLPLGCYWPAGTQHPLTERIAMLTRTSPSRRTRLLATAAVVLIAAGAGLAAWAVQPQRTVVQEAPQPAPLTDEQRAQQWLDRRITELHQEVRAAPTRAQFVPAPPAPEAPRALPAPTRDYFVPVPAPLEAPQAIPAPARPYFVPAPPTPEAPRAAPSPDFFQAVPAPPEEPEAPAPRFFAPVPQPPRAPEFLAPLPPLGEPAPLEAPQELTQAQRDALMKEMEAQRAQMEVQRAELERQRQQMETQRQQFDVLRQQYESQRDKLKLPGDSAALKEKLAAPDKYKLALADAYKADKLPSKELKVRSPDGAIRSKIITPGAGPAGPQKMVLKSLKEQLADMRKQESLTNDKAAKAKLKEAIGMLEELEKRGPN